MAKHVAVGIVGRGFTQMQSDAPVDDCDIQRSAMSFNRQATWISDSPFPSLSSAYTASQFRFKCAQVEFVLRKGQQAIGVIVQG